MIALDSITVGALDIFKSMFIGDEARLLVFQTADNGFYNPMTEPLGRGWFLYMDPSGDLTRLFINEKTIINANGVEFPPATLLEQASAVGLYCKAEGLNPGEFMVYKFFTRIAPIGGASRLWQFHLTKVGEIYNG